MPRTHKNLNATRVDFRDKNKKVLLGPRNIIVNNKLINKILAYSAIKIRANPPLLYSILKPDTSSDSPSAKSKGVRFVSANMDTNHIKARGTEIISKEHFSCITEKSRRLKLPKIKIYTIKINARLTS